MPAEPEYIIGKATPDTGFCLLNRDVVEQAGAWLGGSVMIGMAKPPIHSIYLPDDESPKVITLFEGSSPHGWYWDSVGGELADNKSADLQCRVPYLTKIVRGVGFGNNWVDFIEDIGGLEHYMRATRVGDKSYLRINTRLPQEIAALNRIDLTAQQGVNV